MGKPRGEAVSQDLRDRVLDGIGPNRALAERFGVSPVLCLEGQVPVPRERRAVSARPNRSVRTLRLLIEQIVLAPGKSKGAIGGAVARAFASEGASIFLAGRKLANTAAVAKDIITAGGKVTLDTLRR